MTSGRVQLVVDTKKQEVELTRGVGVAEYVQTFTLEEWR